MTDELGVVREAQLDVLELGLPTSILAPMPWAARIAPSCRGVYKVRTVTVRPVAR